MNIFISGSTSILASTLIESYFGQEATLFIRGDLPKDESAIPAALESTTAGRPMDVVIILDGDEIFNTRITRRYLESAPIQRIKQTQAVCHYFSGQSQKPGMLLLASSVAIYGHSGINASSENSRLGDGFHAKYFQELEAATDSAKKVGIRVLHLRFGNIISRTSQPTFPQLPVFKKLLPAVWHDKKREVSWISSEDAARAIWFIIENEKISNPVNITAEKPIHKKEFLSAIAEKFNLRRTFPLPPFLLNFLFSNDIAALYSLNCNSVPKKLRGAGFSFNDRSMVEYLTGGQEQAH